MQYAGYEMPDLPTAEEYAVYRKVLWFNANETVVTWIEDEAERASRSSREFEMPTQAEFEWLADELRYADYGEFEWDWMRDKYEEIIGKRSRNEDE